MAKVRGLGFEPVRKPACSAEFQDLSGVTHTCHRAAPYWTAWHIHRNTQNWWIGWPLVNWIYYRPLRKLCPGCGQKKNDVTTDRDPYAWELDRTEIDMTACEDCFTRRTAEI